jgi:putative N6-adenine-specific DNA methylase
MVAKTFAGLENVLADELRELGAGDVKVLRRAVGFTGDDEILYKANYLSRTALRILVLIDKFDIKNEEDLYNRVAKTNWSEYMDKDNTFAIDAVVFNSCMTHTQYASLKMKDAIVDQFRRKFGTRPDVDTDKPELRLSIHIENNHCLLYLDSSGSSLNKRGYRIGATEAPINEVLAAGLIRLSGWDAKSNFVDPMCGSGTILIEAAMLACNIPAGYYRRYFCFISWKTFNAEVWKKVTSESEANIIEPGIEILGSDISADSIEIATMNIKNAKLHHDITLKVCPMQESVAPEGGGVMITNPPYDERLEIEDSIGLYKEIGNTFKSSYQGYNAWLISSNTEAMRYVGLYPAEKFFLFNGSLECAYAKYEIYEGSRKGTPRRGEGAEPRQSNYVGGRRDADFVPGGGRELFGEEYNKQENKEDTDMGYRHRRSGGHTKKEDDRPARPFNRDEKRPSRSFDRDSNRSERPFNRDEKRPSRSFDRDSNRSARPFNRDDKRPARSFDRDSNRSARPFNRDDKRPARSFDRDSNRSERPSRDDKRPARSFDRDSNRSERPRESRSGDKREGGFKPRSNRR